MYTLGKLFFFLFVLSLANASLNAAAAVPLLRAGASDIVAELERACPHHEGPISLSPSEAPLLKSLLDSATTRAQTYLAAHPGIRIVNSIEVPIETFILCRSAETPFPALKQAQDLCPTTTLAMITHEARFVQDGARSGAEKTFYHLAFDVDNAVHDTALLQAMLMRACFLHAVDAHHKIVAAAENTYAKAKLLLLPFVILGATIPMGDALSSSWMPLKYLIPAIPFVLIIGYVLLTRNAVTQPHPDYERERQADALTLATLPLSERESLRRFLHDQLSEAAHAHSADPRQLFLNQRIAALGPVQQHPAYDATRPSAVTVIVMIPPAPHTFGPDSLAETATPRRRVVASPGRRAEEAICVICQDVLDPSVLRCTLSCNHTFHKACLDQWIARKNPPTCPLCVRVISLT